MLNIFQKLRQSLQQNESIRQSMALGRDDMVGSVFFESLMCSLEIIDVKFSYCNFYKQPCRE